VARELARSRLAQTIRSDGVPWTLCDRPRFDRGPRRREPSFLTALAGPIQA